MGITIHSDASVKDGIGRGAYVILKKHKGKNNSTETNRHIHRTPTIRTKNSSYMELITIYQALFHAYKLYPDEKNYQVYCDSDDARNKFCSYYKKVLRGTCDQNFINLTRVMTAGLTKPMPNIIMNNVKAHKNKLGTEAERYNFFVDILSSMRSN